MIKLTQRYENLPEKHSTRTGLAEVGAREKNLTFLGQTSISLKKERKKERFLLNDNIVLSICN